MQIRMATEQDFDAYIKVSEGTCYSMELNGSPKQNTMKTNCLMIHSKDKEKDMFSRLVKEEKMYVVEDEEEIVAFGAVGEENRVCKILDFFVVRKHQRKGVGTFFVNSVIKAAKKKRMKKIVLYCEFKGAMEFWKKMGFKEKANRDIETQGNFEKIL